MYIDAESAVLIILRKSRLFVRGIFFIVRGNHTLTSAQIQFAGHDLFPAKNIEDIYFG
jgi:hypothetical protein